MGGANFCVFHLEKKKEFCKVLFIYFLCSFSIDNCKTIQIILCWLCILLKRKKATFCQNKKELTCKKKSRYTLIDKQRIVKNSETTVTSDIMKCDFLNFSFDLKWKVGRVLIRTYLFNNHYFNKNFFDGQDAGRRRWLQWLAQSQRNLLQRQQNFPVLDQWGGSSSLHLHAEGRWCGGGLQTPRFCKCTEVKYIRPK